MVLLCRGALADGPGGDTNDDELARVIAALPRAQTREFDQAPGAAAFRRATITRATRYAPAAGRVMAHELADECWLRERFGLQPAESVAAFGAANHDIALPVWALAPVHLRLGSDHAVLTDPSELRLTEIESASLARSARDVFDAEGMTLSTPSPGQWFLHAPVALDLNGSSRAAASGRNIDVYMPTGGHARWWRKWLTEVQMAWHDHPVNREREARGQPVVNGLWLDGAARQAPRAAFRTVVSADPALLGLARAAGIDAREHAAATLADTLDAARGAGAGDRGCLVDCPRWLEPRLARDAAGWLAAWREFLAQAPAQPTDRDLHWVLTGEQSVVELLATPGDRWRFWRRRRIASLWS